jgi:aspartyl/asparaginyl beta-hydroxylase (cupin superfamily)
MSDNQLDWSSPYVVPARLRFRLTPAGKLRVDPERTSRQSEAVEVEGEHIELLLDFASPRGVEAAFEHAAASWEVDRETYGQLLESWILLGLLRRAEVGAHATTRLALFAEAVAEQAASGAPDFPLVSHFRLQRPAMFYPGLDTREVHDRERFPWVAVLEGAVEVIQAEFAALRASADFSTVNPDYTSKGDWAAAYLWAFGQKVEEVCRWCPETTRLLSRIPGVAQFGTTLFSALAPHTLITPHHGVSNAKLRCQLPLLVPADCKLKIGDSEIEQLEGRCIVFDDSFLHSAWNHSDEARFVLVFDFFHPDLTAEEVEYLSRIPAKETMARHHLGQAAAGAKAAWAKERPIEDARG